mgnify:CR=1 FL=1
MDRIYNRAEDKNCANIILYVSNDLNKVEKVYSDSACTMQCTTSELKNAFMKGRIVAIGSDSMYYPVALSENSETKRAKIICIAASGDTMTPIFLSSIADAR